MNDGGLEHELRKLPGVVACAVGAGGVSLLLTADADPVEVQARASEIAATFGVGSVRVVAPETAGLHRSVRAVRPNRVRLAGAAAGAAAVALLISLVPVGKKLTPRPLPPAAFRPAPETPQGSVLPPVFISSPTPATPVVANPRTVAPKPAARVRPRAGRTRQPDGGGTDPGTPPVVIPPGGSTGEPPPHAECRPPGTATGWSSDRLDSNGAHRRVDRHSDEASHDHWYMCS